MFVFIVVLGSSDHPRNHVCFAGRDYSIANEPPQGGQCKSTFTLWTRGTAERSVRTNEQTYSFLVPNYCFSLAARDCGTPSVRTNEQTYSFLVPRGGQCEPFVLKPNYCSFLAARDWRTLRRTFLVPQDHQGKVAVSHYSCCDYPITCCASYSYTLLLLFFCSFVLFFSVLLLTRSPLDWKKTS